MVARLAVVSKIITAGTHVAPLARSHQRTVGAEIRLGTAPAVQLQSLRPGTACATNVQDVQLRPVTAPAQSSTQVGHFARTHQGTDCIVVAPSFYSKRAGTASRTTTRCCKSHRLQTTSAKITSLRTAPTTTMRHTATRIGSSIHEP